MPVNPTVRQLAQDGRFTLRDAQTLKQAVSSGSVSQAEARDVLSRYAEAMDQDAQTLLSDAFQTAPRARVAVLRRLPQGAIRSDPLQAKTATSPGRRSSTMAISCS